MGGVECDGIYWIDLFNAILLYAMTLEGIFLLLNFGGWVQILNSNTAYKECQELVSMLITH